MSFNILANSYTAWANQINDNFYHIAQGDRIPRGGNSLTATDAAYDLGSSTGAWNNLFCNTLNINNPLAPASTPSAVTVSRLGYSWNLIDEVYAESVAAGSPGLDRNYNLTGEINQVYINAYIDRTISSLALEHGLAVQFYLANTISSTYLVTGGAQRIYYNLVAGTMAASRFSSNDRYVIQSPNKNYSLGASELIQMYGQYSINLKSGLPRMGFNKTFHFEGGGMSYYRDSVFTFENQTTISSIRVTTQNVACRRVKYQLWAR